MVRTFGTWEEAALYASFMRSEGYFAALLDECVAPLYGPAAVGGIRVLLSDEPVTNDVDGLHEDLHEDESPPPSPPDGELVQFIRIATVSLVASGLIVVAFSILQSAQHVQGGLVGLVLLHLAYPVLLSLLFLSLIPLIGPVTRSVRDSKEEGTAGWLFWFVMFLLFLRILYF
jgi:hypothetical protein